MKKGKEIGLYPPYHRPKERPYMNPYSEAILDEEVVLMCRKEIAEKMHGKKCPDDFMSKKLVQRHKMVYEALDELMKHEIHALSMKTLTSDEWDNT